MSEQDRWEKRYGDKDTPWDTGFPSTELQRVVHEKQIPRCRAIELGCGTGANAVWLAQQGFEVTAVDISSLAIQAARNRAAKSLVRVDFRIGDVLEDVELDGPFAFMFDRGCYHVVRRIDARRYFETVRAVTMPGSLALVLTGNARQPKDPGPPVVSEQDIRAEWASLFDILTLREFYFDQVDEGVRFLAWSCFMRRRKETSGINYDSRAGCRARPEAS